MLPVESAGEHTGVRMLSCRENPEPDGPTPRCRYRYYTCRLHTAYIKVETPPLLTMQISGCCCQGFVKKPHMKFGEQQPYENMANEGTLGRI